MILGANGDCICGSCDLSIVNKQDIDLKYYARKEGEVIAVLALNCFFLISYNVNFVELVLSDKLSFQK